VHLDFIEPYRLALVFLILRYAVGLLYASVERGGAVGWGTELQAGRSRVRFAMVSLQFFNDPVVDSASNRNEYQEYLLGVKAAGT
jgi:hypothetical protein